MIIDAHLHITDGFNGFTGTGPTRSLQFGMAMHGDEPIQVLPPLNPGKTVFLPETLIRYMDWIGIDKAVLLQGSFYGDQNKYLYEAHQKWPDRFLPAAFLDPRAADVREQFHRVAEVFDFRILKFEMSEPTGFTGVYPDLRLMDPEMTWIWDEAERRQMVVTLDLGRGRTLAYQTDQVREMVEHYPTLKIVIAHLGQPPLADDKEEELNKLWEQQVRLGKHPNVWFDTSALPAYRNEDYPFNTALRYLRRAAELIGARKLMWGSDIPGLLGQATYLQLLEMIRRHAQFSPDELCGILGQTAWEVYGEAATVER